MNFVRAFPFYLRLGRHAYSFQVAVAAYKKLNPQTGMSVDLVSLNKISTKILSQKAKSKNQTLSHELLSRVEALKTELRKIETDLVSVQFDECRGFSILFENNKVLFIRRDFATDAKGDLYSVTSYFNEDQELQRMKLVNLKLGLEEMFVY